MLCSEAKGAALPEDLQRAAPEEDGKGGRYGNQIRWHRIDSRCGAGLCGAGIHAGVWTHKPGGPDRLRRGTGRPGRFGGLGALGELHHTSFAAVDDLRLSEPLPAGEQAGRSRRQDTAIRHHRLHHRMEHADHRCGHAALRGSPDAAQRHGRKRGSITRRVRSRGSGRARGLDGGLAGLCGAVPVGVYRDRPRAGQTIRLVRRLQGRGLCHGGSPALWVWSTSCSR